MKNNFKQNVEEYIKELEKAKVKYNDKKNAQKEINFDYCFWSGMEHSVIATINDLEKLIEDFENKNKICIDCEKNPVYVNFVGYGYCEECGAVELKYIEELDGYIREDIEFYKLLDDFLADLEIFKYVGGKNDSE